MKILGKPLIALVTVVCTAVGGAQVAGAQDRQALTDNPYQQQIHDIPIADGDGGGNGANEVAPGRENLEPAEPGFDDNRIDNQAGAGWSPTVDPRPMVVPGEMRSDREEIPGGFSKQEADLAEVQEARERLGASGFERAGGVLPQGVAEVLAVQPVNCRTYWPSPYRVCGAIREKYDALGGPASFLTWPRSDELGVPDGVGRRNEFVNGFIYWHPDVGAHAVSTHFSAVWDALGWEAGPLGYPVADEVAVGDGSGRNQVFQGGHIYGSLAGLGSVRGRILERWLEFGGVSGELGYPVGDEAGTPDGRGRFSRFTGGMMYWTPQTDAWPVTGLNLELWGYLGYEKSKYGYPVGLEDYSEVNGEYQPFEGGDFNFWGAFEESPIQVVGGQEIKSLLWEFLQARGVLVDDLRDLIWTTSDVTSQADTQLGGGVFSRAATGRPPWAACGNVDGQRFKVIKSWAIGAGPLVAKEVDLTCGRLDGDAEGYWHIKKGTRSTGYRQRIWRLFKAENGKK